MWLDILIELKSEKLVINIMMDLKVKQLKGPLFSMTCKAIDKQTYRCCKQKCHLKNQHPILAKAQKDNYLNSVQ